MASYFHSSIAEFLRTSTNEILAQLTLGHASDGFAEMRSDLPLTWWDDLGSLHTAIASVVGLRPEALDWHLLLEFTIPRKLKRLDAVLLTSSAIFVLECKTGLGGTEARRQVEEYALLLHYFHKPSDRRHLVPIVVSRSLHENDTTPCALRQQELEFPSLPSYWIAPTQTCGWEDLPALLCEAVSETDARVEIDGAGWNAGAYRPTPTIIEAALALRGGLKIGEIAQSEAAEQDIADVTNSIQAMIEEARLDHQHAICFITGVPGSGKTLVGLSLAHLSESRTDAIHFMSGNGPLD